MYKAVAVLAALMLASCCHAQRGIDVISAARSRGLNTFVAALEVGSQWLILNIHTQQACAAQHAQPLQPP